MKSNTFISAELEIKRIGQNIQIARKRRKLSVSELASKSDVSRQTIMRVETGDPSVGISKVFNILHALGLLKGLSEIVDPELDRSQAIKEIKDLREGVISKNNKVSMKEKKTFTESDLNF
jgi:transcriptional regulator with XRE-family HTH domain